MLGAPVRAVAFGANLGANLDRSAQSAVAYSDLNVIRVIRVIRGRF